jgi:hypothetical protein
MAKKYTWIRIDKDAKQMLDERLKRINQVDLKNIGLRNRRVPQIELTKFLFKNKIFISDKELKLMAHRHKGGKIC